MASKREFDWVTVEAKAAVVTGLRRMNKIINDPSSSLDQVSKAMMAVARFVGSRALKDAEVPDVEDEKEPSGGEGTPSLMAKLEALKEKHAVSQEA
jgi:hypothetical protein